MIRESEQYGISGFAQVNELRPNLPRRRRQVNRSKPDVLSLDHYGLVNHSLDRWVQKHPRR